MRARGSPARAKPACTVAKVASNKPAISGADATRRRTIATTSTSTSTTIRPDDPVMSHPLVRAAAVTYHSHRGEAGRGHSSDMRELRAQSFPNGALSAQIPPRNGNLRREMAQNVLQDAAVPEIVQFFERIDAA